MNTPAALTACPGTVTYQCSSPWLPGGGVIKHISLGSVDAVLLDLRLLFRVGALIRKFRGDRRGAASNLERTWDWEASA